MDGNSPSKCSIAIVPACWKLFTARSLARLMEQARRIEMLDGRLTVRVAPGDPISSIISKARDAAEAVKQAAKQDPLGSLNKEMKLIQRDQSREAAKLRSQQQRDPLGFLYKPTTGATEAVDKILGHEDLILAAASKIWRAVAGVQLVAPSVGGTHLDWYVKTK